MSHQDQGWESKAWEKHRELGTISFQRLQVIKLAQPWVKPQPCHGTRNLPCRILLAVIRAVGHPRGSPRAGANPGQPHASHRLSAVPGTLVGSIRILNEGVEPVASWRLLRAHGAAGGNQNMSQGTWGCRGNGGEG